MPRRADFRCNLKTEVDFVPHGVDFSESQSEKIRETSSFAARVGLRLRPKSACATGVDLGATVSVDLCHRSGLEYLSHGFQTQGTIAARAGLRVRPESACVPRPWISDPRYGCHRSGLEGATRVDLCTWAIDFRPKVRSMST
jgi:hypothetical protein